jgi:hypothetical protein
MGQLVFQATAGGQVALVGPNPSTSFSLNLPAINGTLITSGDTGTVTNTMLASNIYTAPGTIGSVTPNTGAFTTLSASSTVSGTGFSNYLASPPAIGGTTAAAGSFTNLAYTGTLTGGTGIVNLGSGQFYKDASGNVGIGNSTPQSKFNVYGSAGTANITMSDSTLGVSYGGQVRGYGVGAAGGFAELGVLDNGTYTKGVLVSAQANYVSFYTGSTAGASSEKLRIFSSGGVALGSTADPGANNLGIVGNISTTGGSSSFNSSTGNTSINLNALNAAGANCIINMTCPGSNSGYIQYQRSGNQLQVVNQSGGVYLGATGVAWIALSDERFKDIIEPISDALNKVNNLRSVVGKYKTDEEGKRRSFLIAQDVQAVFPEAIDAADPEKLGLAYSDVIPLLVASIKELNAKVDAQAAEIATLKG